MSLTLLRELAFIDGQWRGADSGEVISVQNPASGAILGTVPRMGKGETAQAIHAAAKALPAWRRKTALERAVILRRWFERILANKESLARLMTAEQGKPLAEAEAEIVYAASFIEWFAEEGKRVYGDIIPAHAPDKRILVFKEPVGVVAAITPWNFPSAMITRKAAPALAAGCTMVLKPASQTPFSALALAALGEESGLPSGVFNVVTGSASDIGNELTDNPLVRKLTFTGSTSVGKHLSARCSNTMKKVSMELGGNAPFIVFNDADLDLAVDAAIVSKFRNTGQTCVCANRLLVQDDVYNVFAEKLAKRVSMLTVGDGLQSSSDQGPLIDENAILKVEEHVADALEKGAALMTGGRRHELGGNFYHPTVIRDVTTAMLVAREETFGPIAPLFRFALEDEAISLANDTPFGLASYIFTRDLGRMFRVSDALECGIVGGNTGVISTEVAPFGGVKESGIGREGSKYGIDDYLEIKYLCLSGI